MELGSINKFEHSKELNSVDQPTSVTGLTAPEQQFRFEVFHENGEKRKNQKLTLVIVSL